MRVAAIQMVSGLGRDENLARALLLLEQAASNGAELAVLPEYFCILGKTDTDKLQVRESFTNNPDSQLTPIQWTLSKAAKELNLWIVGGTMPLNIREPENKTQQEFSGRVNNSTLVYNPNGNCVARYDKIHLFKFKNETEFYDETKTLIAGEDIKYFDLQSRDGQIWRVGLSICYDLRFPELYRSLTKEGAELILVPSAFTYTTGQAHWQILLRARAIENLLWILASAQGGVHENKRRTWGHSVVISPWGEEIRSLSSGEGCVVVDIDKQSLVNARGQLPALQHRVI